MIHEKLLNYFNEIALFQRLSGLINLSLNSLSFHIVFMNELFFLVLVLESGYQTADQHHR